ncbi:MAG: hypothetical protein JSU82_01810 [Rhodospirillales bacterium]|nr:MAG: hypothetical protein JSU82_01810 [Rhodospirillales bacterium]
MKTFRKTTIATLAGLGILAAAAMPALSHGPGHGGQAGPGYGPGYGMMGGGMMGGGMMGPGAYGGQRGYGPGMMGPGHGPGFGNGAGFGPCAQQAAATGEEVSVDDVTQRMEHWLAMRGNDRLKLGKVEAIDDDTITAEIVTVDDSLVQKFTIDRKTGWTRPAK